MDANDENAADTRGIGRPSHREGRVGLGFGSGGWSQPCGPGHQVALADDVLVEVLGNEKFALGTVRGEFYGIRGR